MPAAYEFDALVPATYDRLLVPHIFVPYADDLVARLIRFAPDTVLELAAGTGVVTRALARELPTASIVATDLSQAMLDYASSMGTARPVAWQQADAMQLPFDDGQFDAVVCEFGAMFFPDRRVAFAEAARVLRAGGVFIFNVWDSLDNNEIPDAITDALRVFLDDASANFWSTPYGYHDESAIRADLASAFDAVEVDWVEARSRAESPEDAAIGFCQGTPARKLIEERRPGALEDATAAATAAIAARFGATNIDGKIRALVVTARKAG